MKSGMSEIVEILMRRDGISKEVAVQAYQDAKAEILDALLGTSAVDPEDVLAFELGLEPDYLPLFF